MSRWAHFISLAKLARKQPAVMAPPSRPADVGQVGEVASQLLRVVFGERQLPGPIAASVAGLDQFLAQRIVIAHDAR